MTRGTQPEEAAITELFSCCEFISGADLPLLCAQQAEGARKSSYLEKQPLQKINMRIVLLRI